MSLLAYRVIHIFSMMLMFTALGGLIVVSQSKVQTDASRKMAGMLHGIALLLLLVSPASERSPRSAFRIPESGPHGSGSRH